MVLLLCSDIKFFIDEDYLNFEINNLVALDFLLIVTLIIIT